jgi:guanine deaminase
VAAEAQHGQLLERAIALAVENVASRRGGPFGALVARDAVILSEGTNLVTATGDPTAHAEVVAIREACRALQTHQLTGCVLYTSCEPCPMCLGAIYWARLDAVYYAATREDAARASFDDDFIYREIAVPIERRAIPMRRIAGLEGREPFERWMASPDRTPY